MANESNGREQRQIHVQTIHGSIEGYIETGAQIRTLDYLNMFAGKLVSIWEAVVTSPVWSFDSGSLGVNSSAILYVIEKTSFKCDMPKRVEAARFNRVGVRLCLGEYEIQGFLHVAGPGGVLTRLNGEKYPFIALTSASVVGPDSEFAASFLAVNRTHIMAAQELTEDDTDSSESDAEARAECCHEA